MRTIEEWDGDVDLGLLRSVLSSHPVSLAILFGSHAEGTSHSTSDVDVAVEFENYSPSDPAYNGVFLGLGADVSEALETDDVDVVDLQTVSPALAEAIFDRGVLIVGEWERAVDRRRQLTATDTSAQSPRERMDGALARIDAHLGDDSGVPATGEGDPDG